MRHPVILTLCLCASVALSGCDYKEQQKKTDEAVRSIQAEDDTSMTQIMLTVADPNEAVAYFKGRSEAKPDNLNYKRYLAQSLVRANQPTAAIVVWDKVLASPDATNDDRLGNVDALIRANEWKKAKAALNTIPPTYETFDRYRLEAIVADSERQWKKADSFYETAAGLTTKPAGIYNNWGFSKLTRGDYAGAEQLFTQALTYDPTMFTAKNNLVIARGAQRRYDLPIIDMTQNERAQLLYTMAETAIKQGDVAIGKGLLKQAIDTSPQFFPAAQRDYDALNTKVSN